MFLQQLLSGDSEDWSRTYKLTGPEDVSAKDIWVLIIYDTQARQ